MGEGLVLRRVKIRLGQTPIVSLDAQVEPGEILSVMGPSGVGKSTLLSAIIGTLAPEFHLSGRILLNGRDMTDIPTHRRRIGILFQDDLLFPHMSVGQNLAFGLGTGGTRAQRRARIQDALDEVGLSDMADRDPATLSGGQKARVSLMRMLLSGPSALLLDEAFSRLDSDRRARTRDMVFSIAQQRQLPVLMVTHDAEDTQAAGGRVVMLSPTVNEVQTVR